MGCTSSDATARRDSSGSGSEDDKISHSKYHQLDGDPSDIMLTSSALTDSSNSNSDVKSFNDDVCDSPLAAQVNDVNANEFLIVDHRAHAPAITSSSSNNSDRRPSAIASSTAALPPPLLSFSGSTSPPPCPGATDDHAADSDAAAPSKDDDDAPRNFVVAATNSNDSAGSTPPPPPPRPVPRMDFSVLRRSSRDDGSDGIIPSAAAAVTRNDFSLLPDGADTEVLRSRRGSSDLLPGQVAAPDGPADDSTSSSSGSLQSWVAGSSMSTVLSLQESPKPSPVTSPADVKPDAPSFG